MSYRVPRAARRRDYDDYDREVRLEVHSPSLWGQAANFLGQTTSFLWETWVLLQVFYIKISWLFRPTWSILVLLAFALVDFTRYSFDFLYSSSRLIRLNWPDRRTTHTAHVHTKPETTRSVRVERSYSRARPASTTGNTSSLPALSSRHHSHTRGRAVNDDEDMYYYASYEYCSTCSNYVRVTICESCYSYTRRYGRGCRPVCHRRSCHYYRSTRYRSSYSGGYGRGYGGYSGGYGYGGRGYGTDYYSDSRYYDTGYY